MMLFGRAFRTQKTARRTYHRAPRVTKTPVFGVASRGLGDGDSGDKRQNGRANTGGKSRPRRDDPLYVGIAVEYPNCAGFCAAQFGKWRFCGGVPCGFDSRLAQFDRRAFARNKTRT